MNRFVLLLVVCATSTVIAAEPPVPKAAKSTEELVAGLQAAVPLLFGAKPPLSKVELKQGDRKVLLAWYCPTSGEATCRIHTYEFSAEKKEWKLLREQFFRGTHDVAVELPADLRLRIKDVNGKEIYREK